MTDQTETAEIAAPTGEALEPSPTAGPRLRKARPLPGAPVMLTALLLIGLGDLLLWAPPPGLNLFVFSMLASLGIAVNALGRAAWRKVTPTLGLSVVCALPLLEAPSTAAVLLALTGLATEALAAPGLLPARLTALPLTLFRFALVAPFCFVVDLLNASAAGFGLKIDRSLFVWTMPLLFALIFAGLFWSANPVIADLLGKFDPAALAGLLNIWRIAFWLILAVPVWALLQPRLKSWRDKSPSAEPARPIRHSLIFGPSAISRSLIVFNALFAIETLLDLTYLWGGAALPDGMTHAEYAHRGAYPLIVTALLAAAIVLVAMRRNGPAAQNRAIRLLVYAWIVQNILFCLSAMFRLELYVETFSLTELRLDAGIWMGLVAAGLALILLRILLQRSNEWLVAMNLAVLGLTLYCCALTDFPAVIADFNVAHLGEMGELADIGYLESLGPAAIPALDRLTNALAAEANQEDAANYARQLRTRLASSFAERSTDWRSWTFRDWRLASYLESYPSVALPPGTANH